MTGDGKIVLEISPFAKPTVAAEEFLHGRYLQIIGPERGASVLENTLLRTAHEIQLKSRLIQSARSGILGGPAVGFDLDWLVNSRVGYLIENAEEKARRPF